jgi:Tfp pilus assembly protein PilN
MNEHKFATRRYGGSLRNFYVWLVFSIIALCGAAVILLIVTTIKQDMLDDLGSYEEQLTRELSVLGRLKKERTSLEEMSNDGAKKLKKIKKLTELGKNTPYEYLIELAEIIPETVILTAFSFDTKRMDLEGMADSVHGITFFMRELSQSKLFKNPKLISMNRDGRDINFIVQICKA